MGSRTDAPVMGMGIARGGTKGRTAHRRKCIVRSPSGVSVKRSIGFLGLVLMLVTATGIAAWRQAAAVAPAGLSFEVASVKPHAVGPGVQPATFRLRPGGRFEARAITIPLLLAQTHRIQLSQIAGGPAWVSTRRFDIIANAPGNVELSQLPEMIEALLRDRFKFASHTELRKSPVLLLVKAPGNGPFPGLRPTQDCVAEPKAAATLPPCRTTVTVAMGRRISFKSAGIGSMLIAHLTREAKQLVMDRTGLMGSYDVDLAWSSGPEGPSLFTAVQEQLGLQLVPGNEPVETLVIDRLEEPSPN